MTPRDVLNNAINFWKGKEQAAAGTHLHGEYRTMRLVLEHIRREIKACGNAYLPQACEQYFDEDVPLAQFILECRRAYISTAMSVMETVSACEMALGIAPKTLWTLRMKLGMLSPEYHQKNGYYYDKHKA